MDITREILNTNPRERANLLEILFFSYTYKLFIKGYKKVLDIEDLYNPLDSDRSCLLGDRLERKWKAHLKKVETSSGKPSLLIALSQTFWPEYLMTGVILLVDSVFRIMQPLMLGELLDYFRPGSNQTKNDALMYAGAVVFLNGAVTLLTNQYLVLSNHYGMKVRAACCAVIYRKTLKLSRTALGESASGKAVNLLSNDVSRFDVLSLTIHHMWTGPVTSAVIAYFLWSKAGLSGLVGMFPILAVVPTQGYLGRLSSTFRRQTAYKTDERIRLMDEIIFGVQVIKMYAWEKPFEKCVQIARKLELNEVMKLSYIRGIYMTFNLFTTRAALFSSLLTIALTNQAFSAANVFVFMSYFNILSFSMSSMFVRGISEIAECLVAIKRLQIFLLYEEFKAINTITDNDPDVAIKLNKVTTKWNLEATENALYNVNLVVLKGTLLGVIGPVGSGKSCFLQTILGELNISSGIITVNGTISYASQEPWIFSASLRQNIVFGQEYDKKRYNEVIKVCALEKDFKQFPFGDLSVVGEKGASLSGGQKARINLARAVYRDADIYLLDDPLSAVDVAVGKHLYEKCINGYLANKTRILVTHQVHHIQNANNIIILNNGCLEIQGTFTELSESNNYYARSLAAEPDTSEEHFQTEDTERTRQISIGSMHNSVTSSRSNLGSVDGSNLTLNETKEVTVKDLQEESSKGKVDGLLFFKYLLACESYCLVGTTLVLFLLTQVSVSMVDYFVSYWAKQEEAYRYEQRDNSLSDFPRNTYINVYTGLLVALFVLALIRALLFYLLAVKSSKNLHNKMFNCIVHTTMRFFETNPSGRILNRFAKDVGSVDEALPKAILDGAQIILVMCGVLVLVSIIRPYLLIPVVVIGVAFVFLRKVYLKTSKNIKRLDGITRSPVFSHLNTTLQGLTTIRAYGAQKILKEEFDKHQDLHSSACFMYIYTSAAFGFSLDLLCFIYTIIVTFSFVLFKSESSGADVGLAITQTSALTGLLQWGVRQSAEVANQLMSVERILEYTQLPAEKQPKIPKTPSSKWPEFGKICFKNVGLRYSEDGNLVLNNLNVTIQSEEKVGIVGRTGAGKSSLISALFRLAIVEGEIKIDDILTSDLNLQTLRSQISIIPQDPVLFSGTLRYNLDPFQQYSDSVLYRALNEVQLKDPENLINQLEYKVLDRGSNYSVGQRQLICLARALIRNNKILMLDEATANVDPQTDALIQKTIREKFDECTVLTVAHRLNTIMDSDKVLVMDTGTVVDFDHPYILLQNKEGVFYKMVADTGTTMMEHLYSIAKSSYEKKNGPLQ